MKTNKLFIGLVVIFTAFSFSCFGKENLKGFKYNDFLIRGNQREQFRKKSSNMFIKEKSADSSSEKNRTGFYTAPPLNDNFANRITISGTSGKTNGYNDEATYEFDEPWITSLFVNGTNSAWWTWTCPASGNYGFDTICSGFNSVLGIFTGNALSNLKKVVHSNYIRYFDGSTIYDGYVNFNANAGETYQIAVAGSDDEEEGSIILNWYLDTLVVYSNSVSTNYYHGNWPANNGSLLEIHKLNSEDVTYKTNIKNIIVNDFIYENVYTNLTVFDKKNRRILDINSFSDITGKIKWISDFDGKQIIVAEQKSSTNSDAYVHLYSIVKNGLKKINSYYVSNNFGSAQLGKKWIYIYITDWINWHDIELLALNKKLEKTVWKFIPSFSRGGFVRNFPNGVAVYAKMSPARDYFFEIAKKGKYYGEQLLINPSEGYIDYIFDDKGGVLFWNYNNGTNYPMSYLDRKNSEKVKDFLPDDFSLFNRLDFDGKTLYLGKVDDGKVDVRTYKWGKIPKLNGEGSIAGYRKSEIADGKLYIVTTNGNNIAVTEFNKKIKWENSGPGYNIWYLSKKTLVRENTNTNSKILTIIKKKKNVAVHIINK